MIHAAYSPIETIVFFSIIGTLAYFHVLSAIKHSAFFATSNPITLRPSHALFTQNEWVNVRETAWHHAKTAADGAIIPIELQQVVYSLDSVQKSKDVRSSRILAFYVTDAITRLFLLHSTWKCRRSLNPHLT